MLVIPNDRPAYRILAQHGFFGPDDHLYPEGDIVLLDDTPNEEMEPLNEPARERLRAYLQHQDDLARAAAEKNGRQFIGRAKSLDEALANAREDARRVERVSGDGGVPLMGAKRNGASRIERLNVEDAPEDGRRSQERVHQIRTK